MGVAFFFLWVWHFSFCGHGIFQSLCMAFFIHWSWHFSFCRCGIFHSVGVAFLIPWVCHFLFCWCDISHSVGVAFLIPWAWHLLFCRCDISHSVGMVLLFIWAWSSSLTHKFLSSRVTEGFWSRILWKQPLFLRNPNTHTHTHWWIIRRQKNNNSVLSKIPLSQLQSLREQTTVQSVVRVLFWSRTQQGFYLRHLRQNGSRRDERKSFTLEDWWWWTVLSEPPHHRGNVKTDKPVKDYRTTQSLKLYPVIIKSILTLCVVEKMKVSLVYNVYNVTLFT